MLRLSVEHGSSYRYAAGPGAGIEVKSCVRRHLYPHAPGRGLDVSVFHRISAGLDAAASACCPQRTGDSGDLDTP